MRLLVAIAVCLGMWLSMSSAASALTCRNQGGHQICIVSIQRSAKYYWEYRVAVKIDSRDRPIEVYNCRDRQRLQRDGRSLPFELQGAGELICRLAHQQGRG